MALKEIYRTRAGGKHPTNLKVVLIFEDGSESVLEYRKGYDLRYGTNPHQPSAEYEFAGSVLKLDEIKTGKSGMSQTNREDLLHACSILKYFQDPACAIMKHVNPCGVSGIRDVSGIGIRNSLSDAFLHAWDCDYQAGFGGVVVLNKPLDGDAAYATEGKHIEVIGAPDFDEGVMGIFEKRKDLRVIKVSGIEKLPKFVGDEFVPRIKTIEDRLFLETPYLSNIRSVDDLRNTDLSKLPAIVSKRQPTEKEFKGMRQAWHVCPWVRSNGIVLWKNGYSIGIGTGQQDRVTAVRQAKTKNRYLNEKAIEKGISRDDYDMRGGIMASDGFFPYRDSIDECWEAGITAVIQPGGSVKDDEVIAAADEYNMTMVFTGERCFSHH